MKCPYCGNTAKWCENKEIYGQNYGKSYMCWFCKPCDAYVGCHNNTQKPLGTMADPETRQWRQRAHQAFDPLWKGGQMTRIDAYEILNREFGREMHIAECNIEQCKEIIKFLTQ